MLKTRLLLVAAILLSTAKGTATLQFTIHLLHHLTMAEWQLISSSVSSKQEPGFNQDQ